MALTEEQKNKMRAELDKLTPDELKDLNIALSDKLDDEQATARTERQKALYAFLHPDKAEGAPAGDEPSPAEDDPDDKDPYFEKLKAKFKTR